MQKKIWKKKTYTRKIYMYLFEILRRHRESNRLKESIPRAAARSKWRVAASECSDRLAARGGGGGYRDVHYMRARSARARTHTHARNVTSVVLKENVGRQG